MLTLFIIAFEESVRLEVNIIHSLKLRPLATRVFFALFFSYIILYFYQIELFKLAPVICTQSFSWMMPKDISKKESKRKEKEENEDKEIREREQSRSPPRLHLTERSRTPWGLLKTFRGSLKDLLHRRRTLMTAGQDGPRPRLQLRSKSTRVFHGKLGSTKRWRICHRGRVGASDGR